MLLGPIPSEECVISTIKLLSPQQVQSSQILTPIPLLVAKINKMEQCQNVNRALSCCLVFFLCCSTQGTKLAKALFFIKIVTNQFEIQQVINTFCSKNI